MYIYYLLLLTKVYWTDHVQKLWLTLNKLKGKGLKFNTEKHFFVKTEMEYLGCWVTRKKSNKNMKPSNSWKEVRQFIGVVNYYRNILARHSHMLAPLTKITFSKVKFKWDKIEQYAFGVIKRILAHRILYKLIQVLLKNLKFVPMLVSSSY